MPGLILKLRAHEQILVNGVVMQNGDRNARLIIKTPDAKILRLRDAIHPDEVDTPVKRVCYIAQLAVAGEVEADKAARDLTRDIAQLAEALDGLDGAQTLVAAKAALQTQNFYACLRQLRRLLPLEAALLSSGDAAGSDAVGAGALDRAGVDERLTPALQRVKAQPSAGPGVELGRDAGESPGQQHQVHSESPRSSSPTCSRRSARAAPGVDLRPGFAR